MNKYAIIDSFGNRHTISANQVIPIDSGDKRVFTFYGINGIPVAFFVDPSSITVLPEEPPITIQTGV